MEDFNYEEYDHIVESFINGQTTQGKNQFLELKKAKRVIFLRALVECLNQERILGISDHWSANHAYYALNKLIHLIYYS